MATQALNNKEFERSLKAVRKRLKHLDEKAADKIASKAVAAGTTPIAAAIRKAAPKNKSNKSKDHRLSKAVGKKTKKSKGKVASAKVGLNVARKGPKYAPHAALVALGTRDRVRKSGARAGRMPANDFVKRATVSALPEADRRMKAKADTEMEKLVAEAKATIN